MQLTNQQIIFLKMVKSGTAPRSLKNKSAIKLKALGYITMQPMYGWSLTTSGLQIIGELNANQD